MNKDTDLSIRFHWRVDRGRTGWGVVWQAADVGLGVFEREPSPYIADETNTWTLGYHGSPFLILASPFIFRFQHAAPTCLCAAIHDLLFLHSWFHDLWFRALPRSFPLGPCVVDPHQMWVPSRLSPTPPLCIPSCLFLLLRGSSSGPRGSLSTYRPRSTGRYGAYCNVQYYPLSW